MRSSHDGCLLIPATKVMGVRVQSLRAKGKFYDHQSQCVFNCCIHQSYTVITDARFFQRPPKLALLHKRLLRAIKTGFV